MRHKVGLPRHLLAHALLPLALEPMARPIIPPLVKHFRSP
jgi:hypothetical protein